MTIVSQPVRAVEQRLFCDVNGCRKEMTATGRTFLSSPPKYEHRCPAGHMVSISGVQYPRVVHLADPI